MLVLHENATIVEKLLYGSKVTLLGLATVFAVLFIIWAALQIFQVVYFAKNKKPSQQTPEILNTGILTQETVVPSVVDTDENCEVIAAIMAAIYASSGAAPGTLRIISCKRKKTPWNRK